MKSLIVQIITLITTLIFMMDTTFDFVTTTSMPSWCAGYPTGQKYSLELMFANFRAVKIAKDLNPLKITSNRLYMPEYNQGVKLLTITP